MKLSHILALMDVIQGFPLGIYSDTKDGPVEVGSQWHTEFPCTLDIPQYTLDLENPLKWYTYLYPPKRPTENLFVKLGLIEEAQGTHTTH